MTQNSKGFGFWPDMQKLHEFHPLVTQYQSMHQLLHEFDQLYKLHDLPRQLTILTAHACSSDDFVRTYSSTERATIMECHMSLMQLISKLELCYNKIEEELLDFGLNPDTYYQHNQLEYPPFDHDPDADDID